MRCLRDPAFSRLGTVRLVTDRRTDVQTDRHTTTVSTAL